MEETQIALERHEQRLETMERELLELKIVFF